MLQSETYTITDCSFIDNGTTSDHNDIWYNQSNTTATIGDNYTELTETDSGTSFIYRFKIANKISQGTCVECDVYQVDGTSSNALISFLNTSGAGQISVRLDDVNANVGEWVHFKIEWNNNQILINDSVTKNLTISEGYFAFTSPLDTTTIRFKNVNVYPI